MGKSSKPSSKSVSAFAVYSAEAATTHKLKRERAGSSPSLQENMTPAVYHPLNDDKAKPSSSFIKSFSNKAAFSLRRASSKRKAKHKKLLQGVSGTYQQWEPSCIPSTTNSRSPLVNFAPKPVKFGTQQHVKKSTSGISSPKPRESTTNINNNEIMKFNRAAILYKEDASIELSTSQSLNSCEDDDKPSTPAQQIKNSESFAADHLLAVESKPPPKKKFRVEDESICSENKSQIKKRKGNFTNKANISTGSVTTISQKAQDIPKMPFPVGDSENDGKELFEWLIHPYMSHKFFKDIWESRPLLVLRHCPRYADGLFSTKEMNRILNECNVRYSVNLDVTTYQNGRRETHNIDGRAYAPVVWDYFKNGCSIRLKNPQAFSKPVWRLCATLQEFFKCMVGANTYLTPPGTQGFAPHYDDIEAFVLQLEGRKEWTLYSPRSGRETLPRHSSGNFTAEEIGDEIFTQTLEAGNLLYFPRGYIHQAKALPDTHSLHVTISMYQRNSWGDLLEKLLPTTLQNAIIDDVEFRKGLPLDYLSLFGEQNSDKHPDKRRAFMGKISDLFRRLADKVDVDAAADEHGINFLHDAMPPYMTQDEKSRTIHGCDVGMKSPGTPTHYICDIDEKTRIRVLRKNALRIVASQNDTNDNSVVQVFHCVQNPRVYHQEEKKTFEILRQFAPALEFLIHKYPCYVTVGSLPLDSNEDKVNLAISLFEKGILVTEEKIKMLSNP
ncbi:ribosomal oxygenase 1-like [Ciona intestinalis]